VERGALAFFFYQRGSSQFSTAMDISDSSSCFTNRFFSLENGYRFSHYFTPVSRMTDYGDVFASTFAVFLDLGSLVFDSTFFETADLSISESLLSLCYYK
jgi:hypothetical protein